MLKFKFNNPIREEFRISMTPDSKKRQQREMKFGKVRVFRMNPRVWRAAMELADQDALRIEIINADEAIVHNSRKW